MVCGSFALAWMALRTGLVLSDAPKALIVMIAHSQEALSQEVRTSDLAHPRSPSVPPTSTTTPRAAEESVPDEDDDLHASLSRRDCRRPLPMMA